MTQGMRLTDIYRRLRIPRGNDPAVVGRYEASNTLAIQIDGTLLRGPRGHEARCGLALVYEPGDDCVRAIVLERKRSRTSPLTECQLQLLPSLGRGGDRGEDEAPHRVVFFQPAGLSKVQ